MLLTKVESHHPGTENCPTDMVDKERNMKAAYEANEFEDFKSKSKRRKLCELGTGEAVHILSYKSLPEKIEEFERVVQSIAHDLYRTRTAVTDVRVCHPKCGEIYFVITFLTREDLDRFKNGPQRQIHNILEELAETKCGQPSFSTSGSLMPSAHSLDSLVCYLKKRIIGKMHAEHNVHEVKRELSKWYPRRCEYQRYIKWNRERPSQYTRNLIFKNENVEVVLMCWPPNSKSTIHDHDKSSCWVVVVEGCVHEVQYALPTLDRKFIEAEMESPTGAVGRCGSLKVICESKLETQGITATYANNEIGIHRIENRFQSPAFTLHVYAPPLEKMKLFSETGEVHVVQNKAVFESMLSGDRSDIFFDVDSWNKYRSLETVNAM